MIEIEIEKHKYKHFLVECDYGVKSIFEYIEDYCYQFYNSKQLSDKLFQSLNTEETLMLSLSAEKSHFCRLNQSKVRQIGEVQDAQLSISIINI